MRIEETSKSDVLLSIANHKNCPPDLLAKILSRILAMILEVKPEEKISSGVLSAIANNENCTTDILTKILEMIPEEKISSDVLLAIASNENCTTDILANILEVKPEEKISSDVLLAIAKHKESISAVLNNVVEHTNSSTVLLAVVNHDMCTLAILETILRDKKENIDSDVLRAIVKHDICSAEALSAVLEHPMITEYILTHGVIPHKNCTSQIIRDILDFDPNIIPFPVQIINSSVLEGITSSRHFSVSDITKIINGGFRTKITQKVIDNIEKNLSIREEAESHHDYPKHIGLLEQALDENKKRNEL